MSPRALISGCQRQDSGLHVQRRGTAKELPARFNKPLEERRWTVTPAVPLGLPVLRKLLVLRSPLAVFQESESGLQLPASETVHSGRIVRRKLQRRWCGTARRSSGAFQHEAHIGDIASQCRSHPAVAPEDLENLFAFQGIGCLYMADGLRRVSTSS